MNINYKISASVLTLTCALNGFYITPLANTQNNEAVQVSGVWENADEINADISVKYTEAKESQNAAGIAAFYNGDGTLKKLYLQDAAVNNTEAEWSSNINFNECNGKNVKLMLFELDTMKVIGESVELTCDELKSRINHKIPEITDTGKYGIRCAFETNTIERFKYDTYTTQVGEYYLTDEVTANTGLYSCKVSNRSVPDVTVTIQLDDLDTKSKINVSCYVRSAEGISEQPFYFRMRLAQKSGVSYVKVPGTDVISYGDWVYMSGEFDLSQYSLTEAPRVQVLTGNSSSASGGNTKSDYYMDDLLITTDAEGMLYDDMNYTPTEKADNISETASGYTPKNIPIEQDIAALKDTFKDYFKMGIAVADRAMNADSRYGQLINKHFNTMTSEGLFKNANILSTDLQYNFANADRVMEFAKAAGLDEVVGHVLIWENSTAKTYTDKFDTRDDLLAFMKEYITKLVKHFEGDGSADEYANGVDYSDWHVAAWDVVNEAAASEFADGYVDRNGGYIDKIGTDYPIYAFKYANDLGYDIELRYNDFGEHNKRKGDNIYNVAKDIQAADVGLDTVALQSHYTLEDSFENIKYTFEKIASLGIGMDISELDISAYTRKQKEEYKALYDEGIPKSIEYKQTEKLYHLFELYKEYSDILGRVTFWSATDRLSFRNNEGFVHNDYPGIFDRNLQAKPQYWAITDFEEYKKRYPDYSDEVESLNWNFEDEYDYGISREPRIGKWTSVNLNYVQDSTEPSVMNVTDVQNYNKYYAGLGSTPSVATPWATVTDPAYGSTKCMTVYNGTKTSAQALGVRVKLSKEQVKPGETYTISFNHMGNTKHGNYLYAFFRPFSTEDNIEEKYNDSVDGIPWVTAENKIGTGTRCWKKITAEITIEESDFNSYGYTTLWLLARAPYNTETGTYYKTYKDEYLYLDDIALYKKADTSWDFEGTSSDYVSKEPVIGKWTGINQDYIQESTIPDTVSVDTVTNYNVYQASIGSTAGYAKPTGYTIVPADGSKKCMKVNNGTTTSAQALGMRVKLSKADIEPGKEYTLTFWQMSNSVSYSSMYAFLRKYDMTENISEKISASYDAIPWLSEYKSIGNSTRYWMKQVVTLSPTEEDFDENGYTTLWILSRSLVSDGQYHKSLKGEYFYVDDITLEEKSS